jgi:hypothetical protein
MPDIAAARMCSGVLAWGAEMKLGAGELRTTQISTQTRRISM